MPPISKWYMTKNDYYMKIGVIIETLMPPIINYPIIVICTINVSDFHIVVIFTH